MDGTKKGLRQLKWIIIVFVIGVALVGTAWLFGEEVSISGIVYQLGLVLIIVAIINYTLIPNLEALANRKSKEEEFLEKLEDIANRIARLAEESEKTLKQTQMESLVSNSRTILSEISDVMRELKHIREHVDPVYAKIRDRARENS